MKFKNIHIYLLALLTLCLGGCVDDRLYMPDGNIPEGETTVTLEASFNTFTENRLTRAAGEHDGNILDNISNLWIIAYDEKGNIVGRPEKKYSAGDANSGSTNTGGVQSLTNIQIKVPFGKHYIIGVANMKDESFAYSEQVKTLNGLLSMKVNWNETDIASNGEMLGYFREATTEPDPTKAFETVLVNRPGMKLKAWLRRCASKITIDFDGSGLREGVSVYIKEARIYDIPFDCSLGYGPKTYTVNQDDTPETPSEGEEDLYQSVTIPNTLNANSYTNSVESLEENAQGMYRTSSQVISYAVGGSTTMEGEKDVNNGNATPYEDHTKWPQINYKSPELKVDGITDFHSESSNALYFYENIQYYTKDNNENPKRPVLDFTTGGTEYDEKDGVPYGSYVEVEGYYVSTATGNFTQGKIKYRFMLGKNVTNNFEAERNFHYKLTLVLKGNGNEADWHMDFDEQVLEVTQPAVVNYQGRFLVPNDFANLGHDFTDANTIEITSYRNFYESGDQGRIEKTQEPELCKVMYLGADGEYKPGLPDFITMDEAIIAVDPKGLIVKRTLRIKPQTATPISINNSITNAGINTNYNLASATGASEVIENTANCYIVDRKGTYTLPLVYGNAITNETTYEASYKTGLSADHALPILKNHLNNDISSPYILQNKDCKVRSENGAALLWEDESGLITDVEYNEDLYSVTDIVNGTSTKVGGISFKVAKANEGNAVIAVYDESDRIMWSWHIWVTNFTGFDKTITVTKSSPAASWPVETKFDLMTVNLGWCSEGEEILYYPERSCTLKFIAGKMERTVDVLQKSHIAFPRGNNTYYQWGRKDPFWGVDKDGNNKTIYPAGVAKNPDRFYYDDKVGNSTEEAKRRTTLALFKNDEEDSDPDKSNAYYFDYTSGNRLIQQPDRWHNPPRIHTEDYKIDGQNPFDPSWMKPLNEFESRNEIYFNLWGQIDTDKYQYSTVKTVYDPSPVGYMVPHYNVFTSFVTHTTPAPENSFNIDGGGANDPDKNDEYASKNWYDTMKYNIVFGKSSYSTYTDNLFELYIDRSKLQSIIFPENGYRDWDATAKIITFSTNNKGNGYVWAKQMDRNKYLDGLVDVPNQSGFVYLRADAAFNFEFSHSNNLLRPTNSFNTCDGMSVRALKIPSAEPSYPGSDY